MNGNLPTTGSGAKIDEALGSLEEVILLVELDELEGCTRPVAVFFGEMIILIKTSFCVFL